MAATTTASPRTVFSIVAHPGGHVEIDGSGMLEVAPEARPLERVGDAFEMDMDREPLGDVPMGKYKVINTVTRIEPDALVEWNVGTPERGVFGHVYGFEIHSLPTGETEVINYCDWSGVPEKYQDRFPIVPESMMQKTVDSLAALAESRAG